MVTLLVRLNSFTSIQDKNGNWIRGYMGEDESWEADATIREIIAHYRGVLSDDIQLTGSMPIANTLARVLERDFSVFSGLANLLIGLLLFVIFRRFSGVFMPLLVMSLGVLVTMSMMAIIGTPIQISTSILPAFLLAVCVGDSIHLLTIFILPCLISTFPIKRRSLPKDENKGLKPFLAWSARTSTGHPKLIVTVGMLLFVGAIALASQLKFSHYPLAWLPADDPGRIGMMNYEKRMGSTLSFEILLDTGKDRGVINPSAPQVVDTFV